MDKNQEIFEKARYLGLNLDGSTEEEQLQNIAHQVGLPNYNSHTEQPILSKKLDDIYRNRLNDYLDRNVNFVNPFIDQENSTQTRSNPSLPNFQNHKINLSSNKGDSETKNKLQTVKNKINKFNNQINIQNSEAQTQATKKNNENSSIKKEATKEGLKAIGVPSFLANSLNKNISETDGGKENIDFVGISVKLPMIGIGLVVLSIILIIFVTVGGSVSEDDESEVNSNNNVRGYITGSGTEEQLTDELVYLNVCRSNGNRIVEIADCLNSPAGKYFTHLRELYSTYNQLTDSSGNPVELNIGLILETISYDVTNRDMFVEENLANIMAQADALAEAQVEEYQEVGDLYQKTSKSCVTKLDQIVKGLSGETSYYRISNNKYISYLLYGEVHENYNGKAKVYDVDLHPSSDGDCTPEGKTYHPIVEDNDTTTYNGNQKDGYIYLNIVNDNNLSNDELQAETNEILKEIYRRANENYNGGSNLSAGIICSGVMVTGENAGVYSLEDYVAGVVQRENNWYQGDNIENMKAQAVAARTYVLRLTANCTLPIENSTAKQTMSPNPSDKAKKAALETANQVLVNENGEYISTEYDALAVKEITSDYYILKQANLQIPINWITNNISSANLEYYEAHHHGRGMSQWGSRYLQTQGYAYDQILNTFYTSGKLTTLGNSVTGDIPNNVNDLRNRYYFTFDMNIYTGNTLFGQCVWYAKHRAMEIISTSNLDEGSKQTLIQSINSTSGNGQDWFRNPSNTYFKKSTNINDAKAGAIVSWTRGQYGHVAIIERVYTGANGEVMVTLTEGWRTKNSSGTGWYVTNDLWSVVNFRKKELTLSQLQTYSGHFNGYVYLY